MSDKKHDVRRPQREAEPKVDKEADLRQWEVRVSEPMACGVRESSCKWRAESEEAIFVNKYADLFMQSVE